MKILVLQGSPRAEGHTAAMAKAFAQGAGERGHDVTVIAVAQKKIGGCLGCGYCRKQGGVCVQKDDMEEVLEQYRAAEMVVLASPIYCFGITGQLQCALNRTYALGRVEHIKKMALFLSSGRPDAYAGAIAQYRDVCAYLGAADEGIFTAWGKENSSPELLQRLAAFGRGLAET